MIRIILKLDSFIGLIDEWEDGVFPVRLLHRGLDFADDLGVLGRNVILFPDVLR